MNNQHKGLDLAGIIIVYVFSGLVVLGSLVLVIEALSFGFFYTEMFFIFLFYLATLILTILYHVDRIKNYILVGIFGIFVSLVGGIFILVGQNQGNSESTQKPVPSLEEKLRKIEILYEKAILTKEEYDFKRKQIIESDQMIY